MGVYGAIDVGTNSTRLYIGKVEGEIIKPLQLNLETTRIGQGIGSSRYLCLEAMERTLQVLLEYHKEMKKWGVIDYRIVATSAVREAENSEEFLKKASSFGLNIEVISGKEEAELSYLGVKRGLSQVKNPTVVDIGGGSTEFIWSDAGELKVYSVPVGAVRLMENPEVFADIQKTWASLLEQMSSRRQSFLVGVGGTITTLAAIEQGLKVYQPELVHGYTLQRNKIETIYHKLASLTLEERQQIPGLQPERADIILAGISLLLKILRDTGETQLIVSESDLLQGIIWSITNKISLLK